MSSMYGGRRYDRRRMQSAYDFDEDEPFRSRKRQRGAATPRRHLGADAGPAVQVVHAKRGIKIGNKEDVWKFYDSRFKTMQQTACKIIAKAWIKLIAPKKQSHYPYTGQDAKAPGWWPQPWGNARDEKVRHKEPDHLYKAGMPISCTPLTSKVPLTDTWQSVYTSSITFSIWSRSQTIRSTRTLRNWASTSANWRRPRSRHSLAGLAMLIILITPRRGHASRRSSAWQSTRSGSRTARSVRQTCHVVQ